MKRITQLIFAFFSIFFARAQDENFEIIKLSSGPKQHWFGYYDKEQVDPSGRYVLACEVDTFLRSPTNNDLLIVGMIDLKDNNKWIPLGESRAWGWQQGCMLQWIPKSNTEIIWNDIEDERFVCHILDIKTRKKRTLPKPIYTISNDGTFALGTAFERIQYMRPGYGYPGVTDKYVDDKAPNEIGVYKMNLLTGESETVISIGQMAKIPNLGEDLMQHRNYFNHILIAPDDNRFVFLHRWRKESINSEGVISRSGFITRMVTANIDGSEVHILDPSGDTSHFIWDDPKHITMWTKPVGMEWGFYRFTDKSSEIVPVGQGVMTVNGHNTFVPNTNNEWILNDTYPNQNRLQTLYLYHEPTNRKVNLGRFYEPNIYNGEWRCDLHPRNSRDGSFVIFDSTHEGDGRQMYMFKIAELVR
jgi:hypothetical protein